MASAVTDRVRIWNGTIKAGTEVEHERFVSWLQSDEGQRLLSRTLLSSYRLAEDGGKLSVTLTTSEPTSVIKFLRDPRFWPEAWEFRSADPAEALPEAAASRVAWQRKSAEGVRAHE